MDFFSELRPFFDLDFLSSIKHPTVEHWHPHVLLLKLLVNTGPGPFISFVPILYDTFVFSGLRQDVC